MKANAILVILLAASSLAAQELSTGEADSHMGQDAIVCGRVVDIHARRPKVKASQPL